MLEMLLTKEVEINLKGSKPKYYESMGYIIPKKIGSKGKEVCDYSKNIIVKVEDLPKSCEIVIKVQCDYCGKIVDRLYKDYYKRKLSDDSTPNKKDSCYECISLKRKDSDLLIYGVAHTTQLDSTKEKMKQSNLKNWGVEFASQSDIIMTKIINTNLERYGVKCILQDETFKNKIRNTTISRYGVSHYSKTDKSKENYKLKSLDKYGVDHPMKNKLISDKVQLKRINTLYKNGTAPCSLAQLYLFYLIGGNLNYPVNYYNLDIAFPYRMEYVEWDGSGHDMNLKLGQISEEKYNSKALKRWYSLKSRGWKEIRIISLKDRLPENNIVYNIISVAREYLNTGHSWIKFDIDSNKVINSLGSFDFDYGKLRRITKKDLEEVG
jgi:hypothetical protein